MPSVGATCGTSMSSPRKPINPRPASSAVHSGSSIATTAPKTAIRTRIAADRDREAWSLLLGAGAPRDPEISALVASVHADIIERMARNHSDGREPSDELRLALRVFQGAAEAGAQEWLRRGTASREQIQALLSRLLLEIVTHVVPAIPQEAR